MRGHHVRPAPSVWSVLVLLEERQWVEELRHAARTWSSAPRLPCLLAVGRPEPRLRDAWETTRRRENRMRRSNYIFRMSFLICSLARRRAQTPYVLSCFEHPKTLGT